MMRATTELTTNAERSRNRPDTIAQGMAAINIMIGIITKVLTGASSLSLVEAEEQEVQQAVQQSREASESARTTCALPKSVSQTQKKHAEFHA